MKNSMRFMVLSITLSICLIFAVQVQSADQAPDKVIAKVGNEEIHQADIDEITSKVPEPFRKGFAKKALERIIDSLVFSKLAKDAKVDQSAEFKEKLEKEKSRILADYYMSILMEKEGSVTDKEIAEYYEKNKAAFQGDDKVKVAQILVSDKAEAEKAKERINKGESFEDVAKDMTAKGILQKPWTLGWIQKGRLQKDFEQAAFALNKGEVSDILSTKMGYHIIKVLDKQEGVTKSLDQMKSVIQKRIEAEKRSTLFESYRKKANVQILDEEYKADSNPKLFAPKKN